MVMGIYRGFITMSYFIVYTGIVYFSGGDKKGYKTVNVWTQLHVHVFLLPGISL